MNLNKISKTICYILRHNPDEFSVTVDEYGWCNMDLLIMALVRHSRSYEGISKNTIINIVNTDEKGRYEIKNNKIRCLYGHSLNKKIKKEPTLPPIILYHGTTREFYKMIINEGIKPMNRQYVHLSENVDTANEVALRRTKDPTILAIDCESASKNGVLFFKEPNGIWLCEYIESKYIKEI